MSSEKLDGMSAGMKSVEQRERERAEKQRKRERELARNIKMGGAALALTASIIVGAALSNSKKASEIMNNEERAKNAKKIEHVCGVVFHDTANVRQEPYVDNLEPNQSATVEIEDGSVTVDYDGDAYYYKNENDPNGGWYGFEADELAKELLENDYITKFEANDIRNDVITGDGYVWLNDNNVSVETENK